MSGLPSQGLTMEKLVAFSVGSTKKSRFAIEKEKEEQRKKQEDEEAAKAIKVQVYESFVASFEQPSAATSFVRASSSTSADNNAPVFSLPSRVDVFGRELQRDAPASSRGSSSSSSSSGGETKKERQIDGLLLEMKHKKEGGGGSSSSSSGSSSSSSSSSSRGGSREGTKGSFDDGDPSSTNLYIGNVCPMVNEKDLFDLFQIYGAINSVKVMWPRTPEEVARKRNCAFVSFVHRSDAEEAKASVNDQVLQGYIMQIQWGKAVPIGKTPLTASMLAAHTHTQTPYAQAPGVSMMALAPPFIMLETAATNDSSFRMHTQASAWLPPPPPPPPPPPVYNAKAGGKGRTREDAAGAAVDEPNKKLAKTGAQEEQAQAVKKCLTGAQIERQRALEKGIGAGQGLSSEQEEHWRRILRELTVSRSSIKEAMGWAYDRVEGGGVARMCALLIDSLLENNEVEEELAPPPLLVARLYLCSDLLHNSASSLKHASLFRSRIEEGLPRIFDHLGFRLRGIQGRMSANQLSERVLALLGVWHNMSMFSPSFLRKLQDSFTLVAEKVSAPSTSSIGISSQEDEDDVDGQPLVEDDDVDGQPMEDENLDGVPIAGVV